MRDQRGKKGVPWSTFSRASIGLRPAQDLHRVPLADLAANTAEFITEFPNSGPAKPLLYLDSLSRPAQAADSAAPAFAVRVPASVDDAEAFIRGGPVLAG